MNAAAVPARPLVRGLAAAFDDLLGRAVSMRALALLRALAGPAVLLSLWPFLSDALDGRIYRDAFYEPYAGWYPDVPRGVYVGLLLLAAAAAVAMSVGFLTRLATMTTFVIVAYNLFLSTTQFHNNRAYLVVVLGVLAVAPCGRELSLDAWVRRRRGRPAPDPSAPAWPLWLLRFECAAIYGASGLSKLARSRLVRWHRYLAARRAGTRPARPVAPAGLGGLDPDRPGLSHRSGQAHRAHRAVHRGRPVLAWHPLRGRLGRRRLSRRHRGVGIGTGLLVSRHRRAGDLGGAVHQGSRAAHRPDRWSPTAMGAVVRGSTGWLASA